MNVNYPQMHEDFDEMFLYQAMRAMYTETDLKLCAEKRSLKSIYGIKYLLYKGRIEILKLHSIKIKLRLIILIHISTEMFIKRVNNNLSRYKSFREKTLSAAKKFIQNRKK